MNFRLFKCNKCGTVLFSMDSEPFVATCCGEDLVEQIPNSVDASFEKHLPTYTKEDGKIIAKVNHVMEEEHYIEWIMALSDKKEDVRYLEPGMEAVVEFELENIKELYAYCNKHGLWKTEIE